MALLYASVAHGFTLNQPCSSKVELAIMGKVRFHYANPGQAATLLQGRVKRNDFTFPYRQDGTSYLNSSA